jgi:hypothetical protein
MLTAKIYAQALKPVVCTQELVLIRKTSLIKQYSVNKHLRVAVKIEQENANPMESQSYKN